MTLSQLADWIATILLIGLICLQLLLVPGFPLGKAAWGGKYVKLPAGLRIARRKIKKEKMDMGN